MLHWGISALMITYDSQDYRDYENFAPGIFIIVKMKIWRRQPRVARQLFSFILANDTAMTVTSSQNTNLAASSSLCQDYNLCYMYVFLDHK